MMDLDIPERLIPVRDKIDKFVKTKIEYDSLHDTFQGLLFIGDLGKDDYLDETTHRRLPVLITEHFKNSVVCSNCLFCIGASAMQSFSKQNAKRLLPPPKVQTFVCECCKCCGRLAMLTVASSGNLLLCAHVIRLPTTALAAPHGDSRGLGLELQEL